MIGSIQRSTFYNAAPKNQHDSTIGCSENQIFVLRDEKIYGAALGGGCTFFAHFQKSLVKFHNKTKKHANSQRISVH